MPRALRHPGYYRIAEEETSRMGRLARADKLVALAQIHTHPTGYGVIHSPYDDANALSLGEHFLSLVFPDYGVAQRPLKDVGVHERLPGRWALLDVSAASSRICIVSDGA